MKIFPFQNEQTSLPSSNNTWTVILLTRDRFERKATPCVASFEPERDDKSTTICSSIFEYFPSTRGASRASKMQRPLKGRFKKKKNRNGTSVVITGELLSFVARSSITCFLIGEKENRGGERKRKIKFDRGPVTTVRVSRRAARIDSKSQEIESYRVPRLGSDSCQRRGSRKYFFHPAPPSYRLQSADRFITSHCAFAFGRRFVSRRDTADSSPPKFRSNCRQINVTGRARSAALIGAFTAYPGPAARQPVITRTKTVCATL